jgi:hypothetical protein
MCKVNDKVWVVTWRTLESKDRNMELEFEDGTKTISLVLVGVVERVLSNSVVVRHPGNTKSTVKPEYVHGSPSKAYKHLGDLEKANRYYE